MRPSRRLLTVTGAVLALTLLVVAIHVLPAGAAANAIATFVRLAEAEALAEILEEEILDFGLYGYAMSRFAGVWVGLKTMKDTVEATSGVDGDPLSELSQVRTQQDGFELGLSGQEDLHGGRAVGAQVAEQADLFEDLADKVEVRDYARYNFVTPIMKPENMTRSEVLNGVMKNYRRFYMRRSLFSYPWIKDSFKRKYMIGCLKAALKSGFERRFYDLGRINYWGQKNVDFKFDESRVLSEDELVQLNARREKVASSYHDPAVHAKISACGGGPDALFTDHQ